MTEKKKIGELLLEQGFIDKYQLKAALNRQERWGKRLGETLIEMGFIKEDDLLKVLSRIFNMPSIKPDKFEINKSVLNMVPREVCARLSVMPLAVKNINNKKRLVVAMSDPADFSAIDEIQFLTNLKVLPMVSTVNCIRNAINKYYMLPEVEKGEGEISVMSKASKPGEYMEIVRDGREDIVRIEDDGSEIVRGNGEERPGEVRSPRGPSPKTGSEKKAPMDFSKDLDEKLKDFDLEETHAKPSPFADEEYEESTGVFKEGSPFSKLIQMLKNKAVLSDDEMKVLLSVGAKSDVKDLKGNKGIRLLVELLCEKGVLTDKEKKILDE